MGDWIIRSQTDLIFFGLLTRMTLCPTHGHCEKAKKTGSKQRKISKFYLEIRRETWADEHKPALGMISKKKSHDLDV